MRVESTPAALSCVPRRMHLVSDGIREVVGKEEVVHHRGEGRVEGHEEARPHGEGQQRLEEGEEAVGAKG